MALSKRIQLMFDRTAVELCLVHDGFRIGNNSIPIFAVDAVEFLPKSQFPQFIAIDDDKLLPL